MFFRFDVVCRKTGHVLLAMAFDIPPLGFSRRECQRALTHAKHFQKKMDEVAGEKGYTRMTCDDYNTATFWQIVFLRNIVFAPDDPWFGREPWCLYEIIENKVLAEKLKEMDLGVVYDDKNYRLTLVWDEARKGVLEGMEKCPSWDNILREHKDRTDYFPTMDWWKFCARSHAFAVPEWRLRKEGYLRKHLWHRPGLKYDDIVVFDLHGIDLALESEIEGTTFSVAKRANFVHFYTDDKEEFEAVRKQLSGPRKHSLSDRARAARHTARKRAEQKVKLAAWIEASNAVCDVMCALGTGLPGRRALYIPPARVKSKYQHAVNQFLEGKLRIRPEDEMSWNKVERALDILEKCLHDPYVPKEFELWLRWRNKGDAIENAPRGRSAISK